MRSSRPDTRETIRNLLLLRRLERQADPFQWADLASVRDFLETLVGATVRPAEAARLLGISHPALKRWIDKGEISALVTPDGGTEVPLSELLELLEEVEQNRREGIGDRPLARVIRERNRRAVEAVEIDRLLPRRRTRDHRVPELQSLAYHRLVAERLDERLVADARRRLERWRASGSIHPSWAEQWERILAMPVTGVAKAISSNTKTARALRQTSPFAGALNEQERRLLVRAVEERALG
jgi:excisionase family DNA binding protein